MATGYYEAIREMEDERSEALQNAETNYDQAANDSDALYDERATAITNWENQQKEAQDQRTEFEIQKIEQQRADSQKAYEKEQRAAYADWQKQSGKYGVAAEQMAASGLTGSGYSESSQVAMYTSYQKRLVAAKESMDNATISFNNAITEARMQNSSALAEIAFTAFEKAWQNAMSKLEARDMLMGQKESIMNDINAAYDEERAKIEEAQRQHMINIRNNSTIRGPSVEYQSADPTKTLNITSILELGYGRLSAAELNRMVEDGIVETYEEDGEIYFVRAGERPGNAGNASENEPVAEGNSSVGNVSNNVPNNQQGTVPDTTTNKVDGHGTLQKMGDYQIQGNDGKYVPLMKATDGTMWYWDSGEGAYTQYKPDYTDLEMDMDSMNKLGYGNITEEELEDLVKNGFVEEIIDGFNIRFKLTQKGRQSKRAT